MISLGLHNLNNKYYCAFGAYGVMWLRGLSSSVALGNVPAKIELSSGDSKKKMVFLYFISMKGC